MGRSAEAKVTIFGHEVLTGFARDILSKAGLFDDDAGYVASTLTRSSLRGIDTHGIQLLPNLTSRILDGAIDAAAKGAVVRETATTAILDGVNGVGQIIARRACHTAVRLAKASGVGLVAVRNTNHFGSGATWAQEIVDAQMIGIAACNSFPLMAPWGGREARLGTNPLAVSVPSGKAGPWVLDMATSTVAMNKLLVAYRNGEQQIPEGWALNAEGLPTTDVSAAVKGGTLLPVGGSKGAGLAMLIDILSGVLSGGMFGTDVGAFNVAGKPTRTSAFFAAIDIAGFAAPEEIAARMDRFIEMMCSAAPASGFERVMVPGQPEAKIEQQRRHDGIPVSASLLKALQETANKVGAPPLPVM